jgi:predicted nucleic acid-binding protein
MCIIVDANCIHHLVNRTESGKPVLQWLFNPKKKAGLILGGKLTKEVSIVSFLPTLVELDRARRVHRVKESVVTALISTLEAKCKSNDAHVVALALASRCNLVFTSDSKLHEDLKDHAPVKERISIYQTPDHSHLLTSCTCPEMTSG